MRPPHRPEDLWESALDLVGVVVVAVDAWQLLHGRPGWLYPALLVASSAATAVRRSAPTAATVVTSVLCLAVGATTVSPLTCAVLTQVCLFSVAVRRTRPSAFAAAALTAVLLSASVSITSGDPLRYLSVAVVVPWTGLVLGAGLAVRSHRDYVHALEETAAATVAARESETVRRIADERVRIARDLHDSVAHGIAEISVHAGAAEHRLPADPGRALESVVEVRRTSRRVLHELRDVVSVLRSGDDDTTGAPASSRGVPALLTTARRMGLAISSQVTADLGDLEPVTGAALYRALQEALTNAQRHGTGAASVTLCDEDGGVRLVVTNPAPEPGGDAGGFGLVGMRERVEQAGGLLEVTRAPGTFRISAWLPRASAQRPGRARGERA